MAQRFEVWFNNGLFRAFPNVTEVKEDDECFRMRFGGDHQAAIYKANVNFVEIMNEPTEN